MAIKQNSRVKSRAGLQQTLPLLAKGEFGWCVDTLRLFIGNGNVADGAPFAGNTEILTTASSGGGGGFGLQPVSGDVPIDGSHPKDGFNTTFVLPVTPYPNTLILWKNYPQIYDPTGTIGYKFDNSSPNTVIFAQAPQPDDDLAFQCWVS